MAIKFKKIILNNWGPYRAEYGGNIFEELDASKYIFINATPGDGKSMLRNALTYLLCGVVKDIRKDNKKTIAVTDKKDPTPFLTKQALGAPDHEFYIEGFFIDDDSGDTYRIRRDIVVSKNVRTAKDLAKDQVDAKLLVEITDKHGKKSSPADTEDWLSSLMPPSLIDYYIISGSGISDRLSSTSLKNDFEDILGIGKLVHLHKTLEVINKNYLRLSQTSKGIKEGVRENLKLIEENENKIEEIRSIIEVDEGALKTQKTNENDNEEYLKKHAGSTELWKDIEDLKVKKSQHKGRKESNIKHAFDLSSSIWKAFAYEKLLKPENKDESDIRDNGGISLVKSLDKVMNSKSKLYDSLLNSQKSVLAEIFDSNKSLLEHSDDDPMSGFEEFSGQVKNFKDILYHGIDTEQSEMDTCQSQIDTKEKLKGGISYTESENSACKELSKKNIGIRMQISELEKKIKGNYQKIEDIKTANKKLQKDSKSTDINALSENEQLYDISSKLINVVDNAMNRARHSLKEKFETEVNTLWNIVRSDSDKKYFLQLKDSYDYAMATKVESTGEIETIEYTGGNQSFLAALCVTLALAKLAPKKFPLLIDNPFEQGYRPTDAKVVRAWQEIDQQVIISYQDPLTEAVDENNEVITNDNGEPKYEDDINHPCHTSNLSKKFSHAKFFRLVRDADIPTTQVKEVKA
ncbi:hypothetical protein N9A38_02860 [Gammaproteobacteria bacterium]|nr:hypothetical protein [Gammaproteobacteria bacterium]